MRTSCSLSPIAIVLVSLLVPATASAASPTVSNALDRRIPVSIDQLPLTEAMEVVSREAGIEIIVRDDVLPTRRVTGNVPAVFGPNPFAPASAGGEELDARQFNQPQPGVKTSVQQVQHPVSLNSNDISVRSALTLLTLQHDLDFIASGSTIEIIRDRSQEPVDVTRVFAAGDLSLLYSSGKSDLNDKLIDLVMRLIEHSPGKILEATEPSAPTVHWL